MIGRHLRRWDARLRAAHLYSATLTLWMLLIGVLSLTPGMPGGVNSGLLAHLGAYSLLSLLWWLACRRRSAALLAAIGYGAGIELLQAIIPYRACELQDLGINTLAAILGLLPVVVAGQLRRHSC